MTSLAFRLALEQDMPFVLNSWTQSFRTAHAAGLIPMPWYEQVYENVINNWILKRPGVQIWIAYHPGAQDTRSDIYGWICVERGVKVPRRTLELTNGRREWVEKLVETDQPVVHYTFVKAPYRRMGLARSLFKAAGIDPDSEFLYSSKTPVVTKLESKIPNSNWNPLIVRFPKD